MKLLFVCWANVGRSQMAAALYNHLTQSDQADSAGTEVENPGETLGERKARVGRTFTIEAMEELGIDVRGSEMTQVTPEMIKRYDKVVCMAQQEYTPTWLESAPNFIRWNIDDPGGKGLEETIIARDKIREKVQSLIADTTNT